MSFDSRQFFDQHKLARHVWKRVEALERSRALDRTFDNFIFQINFFIFNFQFFLFCFFLFFSIFRESFVAHGYRKAFAASRRRLFPSGARGSSQREHERQRRARDHSRISLLYVLYLRSGSLAASGVLLPPLPFLDLLLSLPLSRRAPFPPRGSVFVLHVSRCPISPDA